MFESILKKIPELPDYTECVACHTKDGRPYQVAKDYSRFKVTLVELASILNNSTDLFDDFITLTGATNFLFTVDVLDESTDSAIKVTFVFKPTERLLDWMAAGRARNFDNTIFVNETAHRESD
ncbi:MAG: hypothetical protein WBV94_07325 [Blastocatellia bacterium]